MIRYLAATLTATLVAAATPSALTAQSLQSRVSSAPDGPVQFSFAARPGVCGNGRSYYSTSSGSYNGYYTSSGDGFRNDPCVPGPVRVVIDRADRLPLSIQTYVGPPHTMARGVTDLGRVRAQEAADFLLSLAATVDGRAGRDAISPAVIADSANTASALVAIAKNTSIVRETRRRALDAMGRSTDGMQTIPTSVTDPILAIARNDLDNQSVRQAALGVLGRLDHGAGIPSLIQLSQQTQSSWLARQSMQTLANSGDPRARQYLRAAVKRTDLPDDVLRVALRSLGQQYATAQDASLLRALYPSLKSDGTRESVFSALADMGGAENVRWLLSLAQDGNQSTTLRRRAADAASRAGAPISDLVKLYDTTTDPGMKQTLISLYIRDGERPAIDKLIAIVKGEENISVRRSAINQLSRSEDPRVKQVLQDIITKS